MQHYAKMYRVARSILYDEQESKDVISDIFDYGILYRFLCIFKNHHAGNFRGMGTGMRNWQNEAS